MATTSSDQGRLSLSEDTVKASSEMGKTNLNILVIGKTGVGKSALINALVGSEVSPESEMEVGTFQVEKISADLYGGITATFYDSPGLHDARGKEKEYLQQILDISDDLDLILYCSKLTDSRVTEEDCDTICEFTQVLGEKFWENAVFVLTFANMVQPKQGRNDPDKKKKALEDKTQLLSKKLREVLRSKAKVKSQIVRKIPIVPAGYYTPENQTLANGSHWFSTFWFACFVKVRDTGKPAVIQGCLDMFETENEKRKLERQQPPAYEPNSGMQLPMPPITPSPPPSYLQPTASYEGALIPAEHARRQIPMSIQMPDDTPDWQVSMNALSSLIGLFGTSGRLISTLMDFGTGLLRFYMDIYDDDDNGDK